MEERTIRINKVLRELNISLERAVDFLKLRDIIIDANPNAKISDREYQLLVEMFRNATKKSLDVIYLEKILNIKLEESKVNVIKRNEFSLDKYGKITRLNLSNNSIYDIGFLSHLKELQDLEIRQNKISDIDSLKGLVKLKKLDLSLNHLVDISGLKHLKSITILLLNENNISDISVLKGLKSISFLSLDNNSISEIESLNFLENLINLSLERNFIRDFKFSYLDKLEFVNISYNPLNSFSGIRELRNLKVLVAMGNGIYDFSSVRFLKELKTLFISENNLSDISFVKDLKSLLNLHVRDNNISQLESISELLMLDSLDLENNNVVDISPLKNLEYLTSIKLTGNPIVDIEGWSLDEGDNNHIDLVKDYFSRIKDNQQEYILPTKILFIGNHASGKSTLLDYLTNENKIRKLSKPESTHIVNIQYYPKDDKQLPKRIYYDFGGQDYYHGIYRAFLSNEAINILLWNSKNENNQVRIDSNNCNTRDFTKEYWLNQLKYNFTKKSKNKDEKNPVLLVQTHADEEGLKKETFKGNYAEFNIENEFFVSLNQDAVSKSEIYVASLNYLEAQIAEDVRNNVKIIKRPEWYGRFINYILSSKSEKGISIHEILKNYDRTLQDDEDDLLSFLRNDLDQLHKQGLILYYKDELPNVAWLDPGSTTQYIHNEILKKGMIATKGILKKDTFIDIDPNIIELLLLQKVIFLEISKNEYIIPNFLPLVEDDKNEYSIITFGLSKPDYVLKFDNFLPFGIVNQLICQFGNNPDIKYFWRDQLIFTLENRAKILIKLDFTNLEIAVYFQFSDNDFEIQKEIKAYVYNCLLAVYWDRQILDFAMFKEIKELNINRAFRMSTEAIQEIVNMAEVFNNKKLLSIKDDDIFDFCNPKIPSDMYISVDHNTFIKGSDFLERIEANEYTINSYEIVESEERCIPDNEKKVLKRKLNLDQSKEKPIYPYQIFTDKKINKMKKVFISYSHDDLKYRKQLQSYLSNLERENKIEIWHDEFIEAGVGWNDKIIGKLEESDIVILLVSQTFISSRYIHEVEMRKTLKQKNTNRSKIIPILVSGCDWVNWNVFIDDKSIENNLEEIETGRLNNYQLMPMSDKDQRLTPINKWEFPEDAWMKVIKQVREFAI